MSGAGAVETIEVRPLRRGPVYEEAWRATEGKRFSAGIWCLIWPLGDRFGREVNPEFVRPEVALEFLYRIGVKGVSFHYPREFGPVNEAVWRDLLQERGMAVTSIAADVFSSSVFRFGGPSSHVEEVRELATRLKIEAQQLCVKYGCAFQTDWAGRDGFEGYFLYEPETQWEWTRTHYARLLRAVEGRAGIAIEFKPYDAPEHAVIKTAEEALMMCEEVERTIRDEIVAEVRRELGADVPTQRFAEEVARRWQPYEHRMGVNIEDAHVYLAGRKVSEALRKCLRQGRLFLRHENDSEGRLDNDLLFGSVHFWDALECSLLLREHGWDGVHEPDIFPQRDDPLKAYVASLNAISFFDALAQKLLEGEGPDRLEALRSSKRASELYDLLQRVLAGGVDYPRIDPELVDRFRTEIASS
ncbi:MAG: hypothetical protein ONB23_01405 [candidate division KSB1 bacterium]|nr:hypothetical protein [candidate division KSB1 bacterium]